MMPHKIDFYTDGSCSNKTWCGGWAMLGVNEDGAILFNDNGNEFNTTNNRMELKAFLAALEEISNIVKENSKYYSEINIITDSAYISNAINQKWYVNWQSNGWRTADRQPIANQDLWKEILVHYIRSINSPNINIKIKKIKAHQTRVVKNSNTEARWNSEVDKIAVAKRTELEGENGLDENISNDAA